MGEGEDDDHSFVQDERWIFLKDYVVRATNIKPDKWAKMVNNDDYRAVVQDFLDKEDQRRLVFTLPPSGQLTPEFRFPKFSKSKSIYFVKNFNTTVCPKSRSKIEESIHYGDTSGNLLEQLASVVDEIHTSVLTNSRNHENWPEVVSKDVLKHQYQLKDDTFVTNGSVKGETLLPLPVGYERIHTNPEYALGIRDDGDDKKTPLDRPLIQNMQTCIIDWAKQVKDIMEQDSSAGTLNGSHPTPQVEIKFWDERERNLWNIHTQLKQGEVRKMATVLEAINSTFYSTLYSIYCEVKENLEKSQDIISYLRVGLG